jgi:hypothetical protein
MASSQKKVWSSIVFDHFIRLGQCMQGYDVTLIKGHLRMSAAP